jgi:hypothetical protein
MTSDESKNAIPIFLDTSVLPDTPNFLGLPFDSLCQLAQSGLVEVYLSEIVLEEWYSHLRESWQRILKEARGKLRQLVRHVWSQDMPGLSEHQASFDQLESNSFKANILARKRFDELVGCLRAKIVPIKEGHTKQVFEKYFGGYLPFGSPKNRDDIPDAFIYQCALSLSDELDQELHCIIADTRLRVSLGRSGSIRTYQSLDEFVKSDLAKDLTSKLTPDRVWKASVDTIVRSLSRLEDTLSEGLGEIIIDAVTWKLVSDPLIPDDNQEAMITQVYETTDIVYSYNAIVDYGPGLLALPFSLNTHSDLEFWVFRGDAYDVPDGVWVEFGDPEKQHYFEAGGSVTLHISGTMALQFDLSVLNEDSMPELQNVGINEVESIDIVETELGVIFHSDSEE